MSARIHITLHTCAPDTPRALLCAGNLPELGEWTVGKDTPAFQPVPTRPGVFEMELCIKVPECDFEFKPVALLAGVTRDAALPRQADIVWADGENYVVSHADMAESAARLAQGAADALILRECWWTGGHADGVGLLRDDPYLAVVKTELQMRFSLYKSAMSDISRQSGGLDAYTRGYTYFGINPVEVQAGELIPGSVPGTVAGSALAGQVYREWAPGAAGLSLIGQFNDWDPHAAPCTRGEGGVWTVFLPARADGTPAIAHDSYVKTAVVYAHDGRAYEPDHAVLAAVDAGHGKVIHAEHRMYARAPWPGGQAVRVWAPALYQHKVPAWIRCARPDPDTAVYCGVHWDPPSAEQHVWRWRRPLPAALPRPLPDVLHCITHATGSADGVPPVVLQDSGKLPLATCDAPSTGLRIYEAHVGMGTEQHRVGSYTEFARDVLPRISMAGYNAVQFMAIQEHPYYASFGYHVSSFFAPSSRCGTPEEFKALVDEAHGAGLLVIIDIVHSHACANIADGLNEFDGTDEGYFHAGERGRHSQWGSRLFNYSAPQVRRFLLSNLRYWQDVYRVDGFRFDGVTSMLYKHHGIGAGFSGNYSEYFGTAADTDSAVYMMLANTVLHAGQVLNAAADSATGLAHSPCPAITIAEDVSGQPGLARPCLEGGLGFDFRLNMAVPDEWIKTLKHCADEAWDLGKIVHTLCNRRWQEKTIGYAESHDQALVGDKTIMMWLADKELYDHMSTMQEYHPRIARGIALHKMIRLMSCALGGQGWLTFSTCGAQSGHFHHIGSGTVSSVESLATIPVTRVCFRLASTVGNEWGHPEWIDFPRAGNNESYQHARRQWHLVDDRLLRYRHLYLWEVGMLHLARAEPWLQPGVPEFVSLKHEQDNIVVAERGDGKAALVFVFNFHPTNSYPGYRVPVPAPGTWRIVLNSDAPEVGGFGQVDPSVTLPSTGRSQAERLDSVLVYLPARTCIVLACDAHGAPAVATAVKAAMDVAK